MLPYLVQSFCWGTHITGYVETKKYLTTSMTGNANSFCFHPLHSGQSAQDEFTAFTSQHFITGSIEERKPLWLQFLKHSMEGVRHKNQMLFRSPMLWDKEQKSREERLELGRMFQLFHIYLVIAEFCSAKNRLQLQVKSQRKLQCDISKKTSH